MIRVDFGEVLLPGGERRPAATFWIGYDINADDWSLNLAWGRRSRNRRHVSTHWPEYDRLFDREFPFARRLGVKVPRWLGECLLCRMKAA